MMIIGNFARDVLSDYENNLAQGLFFDPATGAVCEPGRENGAPPFLFTEVTGYALLDYLLLHSLTGSGEYIAKARRGADWLVSAAQDPCGGVLTRYYFDHDQLPELADTSFSGRRVFAFDTAICLRGLVALYGVTKEGSYLQSAQRMGKFLIDKASGERGEVHALYDAARNAALPEDPNRWSRRFGAFHAKVAEALIDLYAATRDETYRFAAEKICSRVGEFQSSPGNFETSAGRTHLHPHCYAAEGLLHVGRQTGNEKLIEMARRATVWALDRCEEGEIAQDFDFPTGAPRSRFRTDALAQVLGLAADLRRMGRLEERHLGKLDQLARKILQMKSARGHFQYGYYENEYNNGAAANTLSYWTNMFCLRGLYNYYLSDLLDHTRVAILAGGIGSRCWPISCESKPKPLSSSLLGDRTTLQETIGRFTANFFIKPDQVFVLCSEKGLDEARAQAGAAGIPRENIIVEKNPAGTIPAVFEVLKLFAKEANEERNLIVSMADNVIRPYQTFQDALVAALFAARERQCIVSIGKPIDLESDHDHRFGHILYDAEGPYRAHPVNRFEEKPGVEVLRELRLQERRCAWECGTVVFQEAYFKKVTPPLTRGNLAQDLLSSAGKAGGIAMAVSLLAPEVQFEDFGVPGPNLQRFWSGSRYDRGNGNVCLGADPKIQLLACAKNLIVSDRLSIQAYGLENYLILDNATTNTSVVMPLGKVDALPTLYRMLREPERYKAFISGGDAALNAAPASSVIESPAARARSDRGLAIVYGCDEKIVMRRESGRLWIANDEYPQIRPQDFDILAKKEQDDPRLVEHLIQVTALAESFLGGEVVLSDVGREVLNLLCLYHDFGGYLNLSGVARERETINQFKKVSRLNRRSLDSRIVRELLRLNGDGDSTAAVGKVELLDDSVNSAVQLLQLRKFADDDIRDAVIALLQAQDNPHQFVQIKNDFTQAGFHRLVNELAPLFSCLKIAENFANGRWLWKRHVYPMTVDNAPAASARLPAKEPLEDFPAIISFTIRTLLSSDIAPKPYVDRLSEVLSTSSRFLQLIMRCQEQKPLLICDRLYLHLIGERRPDFARLEELISVAIKTISEDPNEAFQLAQLARMPAHLEAIEGHCSALDNSAVKTTAGIIAETYHKHWKLFNQHVCRNSIDRLQY